MKAAIGTIFLLILIIQLSLAAAQPLVIETSVYDVEVSVVTPFGSFVDNAVVQVRKLDNSIVSTSTDFNGKILVREVPKGTVYVKIISWKGFTIDSKWYEASLDDNVVVIEEIGLARVKVVGERGQGIAGVNVVVENTPLSGATGEDGTVEFLLPFGNYVIKVCYGNVCESKSVSVAGGKISETTIQLPVFLELGPELSLSFKDLIILIIVLLAIIVALYIALSEYAVWRRKKIAAALKPV
ncbi:MAG: hypothetical protein J7K82_00060 [Thermoproteales archaeon]|nr:hypothetical protein [Thermoproteales archaeon]